MLGLAMNRIVAIVVVSLVASLPCIAQTPGSGLPPATKADWIGGGPPGGQICGIAQDGHNPEILYVGTNSGIFKSTDGGQSWSIASNGLPRITGFCYHLEIDPSRPAILYTEADAQIFKTIDGGANWEPIDAGFSTDSVPSIDPTNTDRLYITGPGDNRIAKSMNGGKSWTLVGTVPLSGDERLNTSIIVDNTNPAILYVGTGEGVFKSKDSGQTWSSASSDLAHSYIEAMTMDPTNSAILYAASRGKLFQSTTAGASWQLVGDSLTGGFQSLVVDPSNPSKLYVATENQLFVSPERGTWQRITPDIADIVINSFALDLRNSSTLFTSTWTGLFRSSNAGKTWTDSSSGLTSQDFRQLAVLGADGRTVFAAGLYGLLFKSADYGDHWDSVSGLPRGRIWAVTADATGSRMVFTIVDEQIYVSRDAGVTWSLATVNDASTVSSLPRTLESNQPNVIRADFRDKVLYSLDAGETWSLFKPRSPIREPSPSVWIHPHNSQILFASGLSGGLYRSHDGGQTWDRLSETPGSLSYSLFLDVNQDETMYMMNNGGSFPNGTYKSTDGGFHWEPLLVDVPLDAFPEFLAMIPSKPTVLFMALAEDSSCCPRPTSLFKSIDQGIHWSRADSGLPERAGVGPIASAPADASILYLSVGGAGVFKSTDGGEHWRPTDAR
jgi:photosystem II stability/assembly factor-like uncharacterized protein